MSAYSIMMHYGWKLMSCVSKLPPGEEGHYMSLSLF